jgi:hypothetical protein
MIVATNNSNNKKSNERHHHHHYYHYKWHKKIVAIAEIACEASLWDAICAIPLIFGNNSFNF